MNKLSMFAIALVLGTSAGLALSHGPQPEPQAVVSDSASNAAYRDGLYQAKLAVQRGDAAHVSTGRWGSDADRTSFAAGYQQGYQDGQ
jgi:hypothetical protein